jgi:hypothetical protein
VTFAGDWFTVNEAVLQLIVGAFLSILFPVMSDGEAAQLATASHA